jgi:hypothetical protein
MAAAAQAQILQLLQSLDANENPYAAIAAEFKIGLFPSVPSSAIPQLYFLAASLGV